MGRHCTALSCTKLQLQLLLLSLVLAAVCEQAAAGSQGGIQEHCGRNLKDDRFMRYLNLYRLRSRSNGIKRIVGGEGSDAGQWPWLVSLRFRQNDGTFAHMCGGTLIQKKWVLSAAHCFEKNHQFPEISSEPSKWMVRVGEHDMLNATETTHADMPVRRVVLHEGRKFSYRDIALIELEHPIRLDKYRNVACLPGKQDNFQPNTLCYTAGWGHESEESQRHSSVLRHVKVPIVRHSICRSAYASLREEFASFGEQYASYANITDDVLCAGKKEGGGDSCQFDSGGPLLCSNPEDATQWLLAGVISYGYGCGRMGFPGVYTKVTAYLDWINRIV